MKIVYDKLWKLLIDKKMLRNELRQKAGISTNAMAKMGKAENVSTEVLCKICSVLSCKVEDIIDISPEDSEKHYSEK